jgi:hypothetical protein
MRPFKKYSEREREREREREKIMLKKKNNKVKNRKIEKNIQLETFESDYKKLRAFN